VVTCFAAIRADAGRHGIEAAAAIQQWLRVHEQAEEALQCCGFASARRALDENQRAGGQPRLDSFQLSAVEPGAQLIHQSRWASPPFHGGSCCASPDAMRATEHNIRKW